MKDKSFPDPMNGEKFFCVEHCVQLADIIAAAKEKWPHSDLSKISMKIEPVDLYWTGRIGYATMIKVFVD